jgi:pimeloyl-ACP methyl ester carboxylesterase
MDSRTIHGTTSSDGTSIVAHVEGAGPPLVFVYGTGDGEKQQPLTSLHQDQFTCYAVSLRGRGQSDDHPDHSPERLVEDIVAVVESVGEPVPIVGHSRGAGLALGVAAATERVSALALYEPHVPELYSESDVARVQDALGQMEQAVSDGRLADGMRVFFEQVALVTGQEMEALASPQALEPLSPIVPVLARDISAFGLPRSEDQLKLDQVTVPVLLLFGDQSHAYYKEGARRIAGQLSAATLRELAGMGHLGPLFAPEPVARECKAFLSKVPASS